jgi:hypothetical protein
VGLQAGTMGKKGSQYVTKRKKNDPEEVSMKRDSASYNYIKVSEFVFFALSG